MTRSGGFSVRIFIPSGEPEGLRVLEKSNWIGLGLVFPRPLFAEVRRRQELERTGVYILWGPGESTDLPRIYVGEGDQVRTRLEQHAKQKDFWTHAAVFCSKDPYLNKAHVQHLEARLVELARAAKRATLENGNIPQIPSLSEADRADAENFLADLLLCLPVVGLNVFEAPKVEEHRGRLLTLSAKGITAQGMDTPDGFVVRSGATAVRKEVSSCPASISQLRRSLVREGVLVARGTDFELAQDYTFSSPSLAACVLLGRSANGRVEWKDSRGRTLREIQEAEAEGT